MIDTRIRILTIAAAVAVLFLVLELVRRRKLKEEYSVLWVLIAFAVLLLAIWPALLNRITSTIGVQSPSNTIFFFGLLFALVLLLHFSVRVSSLERRLTLLVQEVGLMSVQPPEGDAETEHEAPDGAKPAARELEDASAPPARLEARVAAVERAAARERASS